MRADTDACRDLWARVLALAVDDLRFLHRIAGRNLKPHERKRLNVIAQRCPERFFRSEWFETICRWLEIDAEGFRERLDEEVAA